MQLSLLIDTIHVPSRTQSGPNFWKKKESAVGIVKTSLDNKLGDIAYGPRTPLAP